MRAHPLPAGTTCQWFFHDEQFRRWYSDPVRCWLWYTADPGLGKSVLCRQIIENNQNLPDKIVLYFFFNETDNPHSTMECALQAFLHQLFDKKPDLLGVAANYLGRYGSAAIRHRCHTTFHFALSNSRGLPNSITSGGCTVCD